MSGYLGTPTPGVAKLDVASILIHSRAEDLHADAVIWGLEKLGHSSVFWPAGEYPATQGLSVFFDVNEPGRHTIDMDGRPVRLDGFKAVWNRRHRPPKLSKDIDPRDSEFALEQSDEHLASFFVTACPRALWVNTPAVALKDVNKPYQIRLAKELGFTIPATLFSNSPREILAFFDHLDGRVIHKNYKPTGWAEGEQNVNVFASYTSNVTRDDLKNDAALAFCPGIFQQKIDKSYELRVTVIGDSIFGAKIGLPESEAGRLDWRIEGMNVPLCITEIPPKIEQLCRSYMRHAGMVFGCFDFIVTPSMDCYFIEVNQMGQFLWKEELIPELPMLDAMCEFLISGSAGYVWKPNDNRVRFEDYMNSDHHQRFLRRAGKRDDASAL